MAVDISLQEKFLNIPLEEDTSSPENGAVFFTGPKAKRRAGKLVRSAPEQYKTVIDTPALQAFKEFQPLYFGKDAVFSLKEAYFIGDCISESFAENASGVVRVYLDGLKPNGTFGRVEMGALLENCNVPGFLVYDASPRISGVEPFEEMEMNKQQFKDYAERIMGCCLRVREVGQSLEKSDCGDPEP